MKRILSILFLIAAVVFTHDLSAQTGGGKKKKAAKKSQPSASSKSDSTNTDQGDISIDEGGQTRPTKGHGSNRKTNSDSTATKKKGDEAPKDAAKTEAAPAQAPIAIDDEGQTKVKPKGTTSNPSDSTAAAPAKTLERPKED
jgi:hypothetical protein